MAVRAATDGHNSIPPDGDEGLGSVIDTATAVLALSFHRGMWADRRA